MDKPEKKPDVFMPLYIGDYFGGTSRLTTEQHGAYLLMIMDYWMNGPLPDDDAILASITRLNQDAWSMHKQCLKHFFSIENGVWKHKRVEEELAKAYEQKRKAEDKARRAAEARWAKKQQEAENESSSNATSNAQASPQAMHEECPSPSPSPSDNNSLSHSKTIREAGWEFGEKQLALLRYHRKDLVDRAFEIAEKFRTHFEATGERFEDWDARWEKWVLDEKRLDYG